LIDFQIKRRLRSNKRFKFCFPFCAGWTNFVTSQHTIKCTWTQGEMSQFTNSCSHHSDIEPLIDGIWLPTKFKFITGCFFNTSNSVRQSIANGFSSVLSHSSKKKRKPIPRDSYAWVNAPFFTISFAHYGSKFFVMKPLEKWRWAKLR
jgi:hypothetical protein